MRFPSRAAIAIGAAVLATSLAACGSDNNKSSGSSSGSSTTSSQPSGQGKKIAYLAAARGNAYVDAAIKAVQAEANKLGVKLTIFDAQFNPGKQLAQCQDAITRKFDGIVALPAAGVPLTPCAAQAAAAKIPFVDTNQPIGTSTTSGEPTAKGVTGQVLTPLATVAGNDVKQVVAACGKANPCNVVLLSAAKILPQQAKAYQDALKQARSANPNIKVTAVDAGADRAGGLKAMQDALQRVSKPTVVTSPNTQPIEGAVQALTESGLTPGKDVKLATNGGTSFQLDAIRSGKYFSTYIQLPASEAQLALQYVIKAAGGGTAPTWTDPHKPRNLPYEVTKSNLSDTGDFKGEW
jgi:ABC-type sugar transport system substrate-binding protein